MYDLTKFIKDTRYLKFRTENEEIRRIHINKILDTDYEGYRLYKRLDKDDQGIKVQIQF